MSVICYDMCGAVHTAITFKILDALLLEPMNKPGTPSRGIKVSVDVPYFRHKVINVQRPQVLRQYFGEYNEETQMISAYGVGSGRITVGTSPRQVQFHYLYELHQQFLKLTHVTCTKTLDSETIYT